ncbi:zinc finger, CCHC-type containing protein [Tanacetum coccineum]
MRVVYILTIPMPKDGEDATVEHIRKRSKWENDDYVCHGIILNEFLVSDFTNYKMTDSRPVMEQYNELLGILGRFTQHKINMDKAIQVSCIIDKLISSCKSFKHTLKHKKDELTLVELGSHLRIEKSLRVQDSDKPKGNNVSGPSIVNIVEHNNSSSVRNLDTWFSKWLTTKPMVQAHGSVNGSFNSLKDNDVAWWVDSRATVHVCKDRCWFKTYESLNDGSILHIGNQSTTLVHGRGCVDLRFSSGKIVFLFNVLHNRFSSVHRPSQRSLIYRIKDIGGSVVPEEVTEEDKSKTFHEAMESHDVAFWKEAINDETDSIMGNNTWVLADLPPGCKWILKKKMKVDGTIEKFKARLVIQGFRQKSGIDYFNTYALVARINTIRLLITFVSIHNLIIHQMDVKTTFLNGELEEESHYIEKVLKKFNYFDCTPVSTFMDTSEKLMPNNSQVVSQLKYSRVINCLMYAMTCTRPDIDFAMGKLSRYTSNPSTQNWQAIHRVFLLGGGAISLASKKQTCITSSIIESEFVALSAAGKEAEWLRNLILEISLWSKPITLIFICCDSAATLAKAYSQMYNGKSRHLGFKHSMIRELIMNGVVSIEFVRSQQNLADHLTKGLARYLVIKSAKGMGLKSNLVIEC